MRECEREIKRGREKEESDREGERASWVSDLHWVASR